MSIQVYCVKNLINRRKPNPLVAWFHGETPADFVRRLKGSLGSRNEHNLRIEVAGHPEKFWTTANLAGLESFPTEVADGSELIVKRLSKRKPTRTTRELFNLKSMSPAAIKGDMLSLTTRKKLRQMRQVFEQIFGSEYNVLNPVLLCCPLCGKNISCGGTLSPFTTHVKRTHKNLNLLDCIIRKMPYMGEDTTFLKTKACKLFAEVPLM